MSATWKTTEDREKHRKKLEGRVTGDKSTMFSTAQYLFITAACGLLTFEYLWIRFPGGLIVKAKKVTYADFQLKEFEFSVIDDIV